MRRGRKVKRICRRCKVEFEALAIKVNDGGGHFCNTKCYQEYRCENRKDPKIQNIYYQKKHHYNLSSEEYLKLMENINCAICNCEFNEKTKKHIDHCHVSEIVRGVLCNNCNTGLGFFSDSIESLMKAIKYLNESNKINSI